MKILKIFDNGGETADRYTIWFDVKVKHFGGKNNMNQCLLVGDDCDRANGVSMWAEGCIGSYGKDKEIQFESLPENVQKHVLERMGED
jgi:hypothetical protein